MSPSPARSHAVRSSKRSLERGFQVFALNPEPWDRFRDRQTAAGAKDDRRDAWVRAGALRTDRTQAGAAPVTRQRGKTAVVTMRRACNRRLRTALYRRARVSVQVDARCRAHHDRPRQRGHGHARALRGVVDRSLAVLVVRLTSRTLHDPSAGA